MAITEADIRRINRRYSDIVKTFGADSQYATPYTTRMIKLGAFVNEEGILQISKGKAKRAELERNAVHSKNIERLTKLSKVQDINRRVSKILKEEGINPEGKRGKYSKEQITERVSLENDVHRAIEEIGGNLYKDADNVKGIVQGNNGRLTQAEMQEILDTYNRLNGSGTIRKDLPFDSEE